MAQLTIDRTPIRNGTANIPGLVAAALAAVEQIRELGSASDTGWLSETAATCLDTVTRAADITWLLVDHAIRRGDGSTVLAWLSLLHGLGLALDEAPADLALEARDVRRLLDDLGTEPPALRDLSAAPASDLPADAAELIADVLREIATDLPEVSRPSRQSHVADADDLDGGWPTVPALVDIPLVETNDLDTLLAATGGTLIDLDSTVVRTIDPFEFAER